MFKWKLASSAVFLFTLLGAESALCGTNAVDGDYWANAVNGGTATAVMRPISTHFCVLSRVGIRDTDSGSEMASCRVGRSGTVWILQAILQQNNDADAYCNATCFTRSSF